MCVRRTRAATQGEPNEKIRGKNPRLWTVEETPASSQTRTLSLSSWTPGATSVLSGQHPPQRDTSLVAGLRRTTRECLSNQTPSTTPLKRREVLMQPNSF